MAELDEKTQKIVDKAVKTAKKDQLKLVVDAIKSQQDDAKSLEGEGKAKTLVGGALRDTLKAVKEAVAE